jgi:hypothetical protein
MFATTTSITKIMGVIYDSYQDAILDFIYSIYYRITIHSMEDRLLAPITNNGKLKDIFSDGVLDANIRKILSNVAIPDNGATNIVVILVFLRLNILDLYRALDDSMGVNHAK